MAPADLLKARLTLRRLSAREVDILRPAASGNHSDPLALLHPPLAIRLEHGEIERLVIGAAFTGEPAAATLSASGTLGGGEAAADLDLHRIDATPGNAKLHLALSGTPPRLTLEGDIEEPSGRLLASLTGQTQPLPLSGAPRRRRPARAMAWQPCAQAGRPRRWRPTSRSPGSSRPQAARSFRRAAAGARSSWGNSDLRRRRELAGTASAAASSPLPRRRQARRQRTLRPRHTALAGEGEIELADLGDLTPLLSGVAGERQRHPALALGGSPRARGAADAFRRAAGAGGKPRRCRACDGRYRVAGDALDAASPIDLSASGDAAGVRSGRQACRAGSATGSIGASPGGSTARCSGSTCTSSP